ncbi:hypothetical protein Tco_1045817 [Tanacetum coccineum]|uniref:Uncharacterized protein n=1 Tax=Tanacetum coccineum TaxID=301880 RepID=A0ABQ5GVS0_9ASTR
MSDGSGSLEVFLGALFQPSVVGADCSAYHIIYGALHLAWGHQLVAYFFSMLCSLRRNQLRRSSLYQFAHFWLVSMLAAWVTRQASPYYPVGNRVDAVRSTSLTTSCFVA